MTLPDYSQWQTLCPPVIKQISASHGDFHLYIPKSIPKNMCLISSQVGFDTTFGCLQYTDRSLLTALVWSQRHPTPC